MIKIYSSNNEFLVLLDTYKDAFYTTETLSTGSSPCALRSRVWKKCLIISKRRTYVETPDYRYIIKEINMNDNDFIEVHCGPDYETLKGRLFKVFDCYKVSLKDAYEYCVSRSTGWTVEYNSAKPRNCHIPIRKCIWV